MWPAERFLNRLRWLCEEVGSLGHAGRGCRRPKSGTPSGARPRSLGVTLSSDLERMLEEAAVVPSKASGIQEVDVDAILAEPCLKKSASPPSHTRRLPLDTDSLGLISRLSSQEIPVVLEGLAEIFSEPLHVTEARYQQMIQRSEEMTKTALQIIADFWSRDRSHEDSEC
ncbi:hypothetical protein HPB51_023352 [Rhipicephalus microplus]|uniref:Uncharacterized protein n=1 Tax=Rhipicephalus microplus TaxID=6941 RepID=A0A9J6EJR4_RHIMP|nr:hypothetical protein HPB51_023352 [Rhipicephalus microplus]